MLWWSLCNTESSSCTPGTNVTLHVNYTSIKKCFFSFSKQKPVLHKSLYNIKYFQVLWIHLSGGILKIKPLTLEECRNFWKDFTNMMVNFIQNYYSTQFEQQFPNALRIRTATTPGKEVSKLANCATLHNLSKHNDQCYQGLC